MVIVLVIKIKYKYGKRCPINSLNSDNDQDANYRSFKFENNLNLVSERSTPDSLTDSALDLAQQTANTDLYQGSESSSGKLFQIGFKQEQSGDSLRQNIRVNHGENDHSWTPFLHNQSPESVL